MTRGHTPGIASPGLRDLLLSSWEITNSASLYAAWVPVWMISDRGPGLFVT